MEYIVCTTSVILGLIYLLLHVEGPSHFESITATSLSGREAMKQAYMSTEYSDFYHSKFVDVTCTVVTF